MDSIEVTVMQLELELLDPGVRSDAVRLDTLIADDFLEVGASGLSFGKAAVLARLPEERGVVFLASAMQAYTLAPNVVLVTYTVERSQQGHTIRSHRSSVWLNNPCGWQVRYHQGTTAT